VTSGTSRNRPVSPHPLNAHSSSQNAVYSSTAERSNSFANETMSYLNI
jgi:hypothetical protein